MPRRSLGRREKEDLLNFGIPNIYPWITQALDLTSFSGFDFGRVIAGCVGRRRPRRHHFALLCNLLYLFQPKKIYMLCTIYHWITEKLPRRSHSQSGIEVGVWTVGPETLQLSCLDLAWTVL